MDDIDRYVVDNPGQTSTQIAKFFGRKVSTISSLLAKKAKTGLILRKPGGFPRGGYAHYWHEPPRDREQDKTLWCHLMEED